MTATRLRRALLVALLVAPLAACSASLPQPQAAHLPVPPPAVTPEQSQAVATAVGEALTAGDEALEATALETRLSGPALAIRRAEYVRATVDAGRPPTALPTTEVSAVLPQTNTWPRTFLVITEQPSDLGPPRILVLHQESARDQYKLWGWAQIFPGQRMPATAALAVGSPVLEATDSSLVVPPVNLLPQYADILTNGDASEFAAMFAPDKFREWVQADRAQHEQQLDGASYTVGYAAPEAPLAVLGTLDGGALVIGQLTGTTTTTATTTGARVGAGEFEKALAGGQAPTTSLVVTSTAVVVLYVPPASAGGQVVGLASQNSFTAATAS
ncbi:MAG: hypothetical protein FWD18_11435 [Micrococcales bacterium]|nr:hypothetical protein [Micrococcales bacterium]